MIATKCASCGQILHLEESDDRTLYCDNPCHKTSLSVEGGQDGVWINPTDRDLELLVESLKPKKKRKK